MRNPFSVIDVPDPAGPDVEAFAERIGETDLEHDENAMAWVAIATEVEGLEGAWSSRRRTGSDAWQQGVATVHIQNERVFILFKDTTSYLIEGIRRGDRVIGRSVATADPSDSSPWVGTIVNGYRIDGHWKGGRWDFRRCSPDERPEPILDAVLTEARQLSSSAMRELLVFARYLRWRGTSDS